MSAMIQLEEILDVLRTVIEPESGRNIVRLGWVRDLHVEESGIQFTILLADPSIAFASEVSDISRDALQEKFGSDTHVAIDIDSEMIGMGMDHQISGQKNEIKPGDGVVNIIAVASGKGGVGKSTVACNLSVALAQAGYDVGLADVDIYGPSIPTMFGIEDAKPRVSDKRRIIPLEKYGVKLLSMGFLVDPDKAVIWRGPMVTSAVRQFLSDTDWGELDYLILDLPPGTGDIQLTIVQTVPLGGAVIVSTPQRVALTDARKGVGMFDQVNVPVLGIIENMAYFIPPDLPDKKYYLFGQGGAKALADELNVPFLGEIPLEQIVRESGDAGTPAVTDPTLPVAAVFSELARSLVDRVEYRKATGPSTQKIEILHR